MCCHTRWLRQAEADLRHARNAPEDGDHEWACFAAQQAAEKAVKSVVQALGGEAWAAEAEAAITDAETILEFSRGAVG